MDSLVDKAVTQLMGKNAFMGLSVGIFDKDEMYRYHYGTVEKGKTQLPDDQTVYEIASLTKTFTGCLLAKALSENRIKLTDDIRQYLKEPYPNLEYKGTFITIRDLVTHQSGLPLNIPFDPKMWKKPNFDSLPYQINRLEAGYTVKDWLRELHNIKLTVKPASIDFQYSNIGTNLIGIALENIYGSSYEQLLQDWILKPLDMTETKLTLAEIDTLHLAKGYNTEGKQMPYLLDNMRAAGAIKSSLKDMLNYLVFQMKETETIPQISHTSVWTNKDKSFQMGLGWQILTANKGSRNIFQDGGAYGFASTITLFPDKQLGFVLLTNTSGPNTQNQLRNIAESIVEGLNKK